MRPQMKSSIDQPWVWVGWVFRHELPDFGQVSRPCIVDSGRIKGIRLVTDESLVVQLLRDQGCGQQQGVARPTTMQGLLCSLFAPVDKNAPEIAFVLRESLKANGSLALRVLTLNCSIVLEAMQCVDVADFVRHKIPWRRGGRQSASRKAQRCSFVVAWRQCRDVNFAT